MDLVGGGVDSRGGYILKILYVKMKELGPLGGRAPDAPPRSANEYKQMDKSQIQLFLALISGGSRISHRGGHGLPRRVRFETFVCQNERIGTLRSANANKRIASSGASLPKGDR